MAYIEMNYKSESLMRSVSLNVFLPCCDGWENAEKPFKTLYFLPGFSASGKELSTSLSFRLQSMMKGIAVVIPDGDNSFYVDRPDRFAWYSKFVGSEIVEVTRSIFPLSVKREDTFIGGISMGGYGALLNGLRYREIFGKIAAMSPGLDFYDLMERGVNGFTREYLDGLFGSREEFERTDLGLDPAYLEAKKAGEEIPELFMCCGRQDELVYENNVRFVKFLQENQIPVDYREDDGGHDVMFWDKFMDPVFAFLAQK